jgi:integrase
VYTNREAYARGGEVFALRWRDVDEAARLLTGREAAYDGRFSTPKTEAGVRPAPLSATALGLAKAWRGVRAVVPAALMFSTRSGTPIMPNNVLRRAVFPA